MPPPHKRREVVQLGAEDLGKVGKERAGAGGREKEGKTTSRTKGGYVLSRRVSLYGGHRAAWVIWGLEEKSPFLTPSRAVLRVSIVFLKQGAVPSGGKNKNQSPAKDVEKFGGNSIARPRGKTLLNHPAYSER